MVKESLLTFVSRGLFLSANLLAVIVVSRLLGPEGQGVFSLFKSFLGVQTLVFCLGMQFAFVYFVGQRFYDVGEAVGISLMATLFLGGMGALAGWGGFILFPKLFQGIDRPFFVVMTITFPLYLLMTYLTNIWLGIGRVGRYNLYYAVFALIQVLLLGLLMIVKRDVAILPWTLAGAALVTVLPSLVEFSRVSRWSFRWSSFFRTAAFGIKGQLGNLVAFLNYRLGIFLLNYHLGSSEVGLYSVAVGLAESVWQVVSVMAVPLYSKVASTAAKEESARLVAKAGRVAVFLSAVICLGLAIVLPFVVPWLFGPRFRGMLKPFYLLLPGVFVFSVTTVVSNYLVGRGRPFLNTIVTAAAFLLNVTGNFLLVPRWGMTGAALTADVSYAVATFLTLLFVRKESGQPWSALLFLRKDDWDSLRCALTGTLRFGRDGNVAGSQHVT